MQLVINIYGSYLRKKGNCFLVKTGEFGNKLEIEKIGKWKIGK